MTEGHDYAVEVTDRSHERATDVLGELVSVASADRVYSEPVSAGDTTVITAAEVHTGMGFGYGLGVGPRGWSWGRGRRTAPGGGGGGGGHSAGRPVAVVTIDPEGVHVEPVLDRSRIIVTAVTTLGAIGLTLIRARRAGRG